MTDRTKAPGGPPTRQDFERDVIARARADAAFRADLIADPRAAIRKAYGLELPPSVELRVVEETPSVFYLVLPLSSQALTDEQVSAVAGAAGVSGLFPKVHAEATSDKG